MKKLLTILTTSSAVFLITVGVTIFNKFNNENTFYFSKKITPRQHKIENGVLKEVGYYLQGNKVRIHTIRYNVHTIDADLPEEITSLRSAFVGNNHAIKWKRKWNTSNITDMNGTFYGSKWINDESIKEWNTSNVTDMEGMFAYTGEFDQDLSKWDVSNVRNFKKMFEGAEKYNNNDQPLKWGDKLKNADNMENMFHNSKFNHSLGDWKLDKNVINKNFGLDAEKQPKWKIESAKPTYSSSTTQSSNPSVNSSKSEDISDSSPSANSEFGSKASKISPDVTTPKVNKIKDESKNNQVETSGDSKNSLEKITETVDIKNKRNKSDNLKDTSNDIFRIPTKPNTIISKSNSPNAGVIAGAVLGGFTILGTTAGLGYYYRKILKNLYLKSADKLKPSLLKSKDNIKDFYVKSIDKTKNLYLKSKNKIKDKIAKIKSKK
ncbi:BspA family leucine-rich repeat surface protein [Mycoplasma capricolum subsp. capricolum]|uniref:BspA family leucine-rich repeat surface protein n=1 Tax=Mycoplasma capricolum TaxID=2095 RepID=UPI003DA47148